MPTIDYSDAEIKTPSKLPEPSGYRLLIALPEMEETTKGGIHIPDERRNAEQTASIVGFVLAVGPDAYMDKTKFPTGPWCKKGDWVIMSPYTGTRVSVHGQEFRLINDDSIFAVVDDPRGIARTGR